METKGSKAAIFLDILHAKHAIHVEDIFLAEFLSYFINRNKIPAQFFENRFPVQIHKVKLAANYTISIIQSNRKLKKKPCKIIKKWAKHLKNETAVAFLASHSKTRFQIQATLTKISLI